MDRIKSCLNPECDMCKEGTSFPFKYKYCPICNSELQHVCSNKRCFNIVENPLEIYCDSCLEKMAQKQQEHKELRDKIIDKAIDSASAFTAGAAAIGPLVKKHGKKAIELVKNLKK